LNRREKAEFLGQNPIGEDAQPVTAAVAMGQSTVAHALYEKILANGMQGVFPFVFIDFGHTRTLTHN
jgi:hypothetical protein